MIMIEYSSNLVPTESKFLLYRQRNYMHQNLRNPCTLSQDVLAFLEFRLETFFVYQVCILSLKLKLDSNDTFSLVILMLG